MKRLQESLMNAASVSVKTQMYYRCQDSGRCGVEQVQHYKTSCLYSGGTAGEVKLPMPLESRRYK